MAWAYPSLPLSLPFPLCSFGHCWAPRQACVCWLPEESRPGLRRLLLSGPFPLSETIFSGSQGGAKLLQGISCPEVYIWPQQEEREVGFRKGGWDVEVVVQGQNRWAPTFCRTGEGSRTWWISLLWSKFVCSQELGMGELSAPWGRMPPPSCSLSSILTPLGLGSWMYDFCPRAKWAASQPVCWVADACSVLCPHCGDARGGGEVKGLHNV